MMKKFAKFFLTTTILLAAFFVAFPVFADTPKIISMTLNGQAQNISFNPNNSESVSIEIKADKPVKFTRLYICSLSQECNGSSGNYTRYFTQSDISDTITKAWNGKTSGDAGLASSGEYKVMVSMLEDGASTAITEFGSYHINIDFSLESQSTSTATTTDSTSTSTNSTSTGQATDSNLNTQTATKTVVRYVSVHSNQDDLSNYDESSLFEVSAGRDRIAYIGTPVYFSAKHKLAKSIDGTPHYFYWSFGDGSSERNEEVSHIYKFKGEYNVVLNGECGMSRSVSRTTIKVLSPELSAVILPDGNLEFSDLGKVEINIGEWKVRSASGDFVFPQDTIIGAGKSIILPKEISEISPDINDGISIFDPSGKIVLKIFPNTDKQNNISISTTTSISIDTPNIRNNISFTKDETDKFASEFKRISIKTQVPSVIQKSAILNSYDSTSTEQISQVATVSEVSSSSAGFFKNLFSIPTRGIKAIFRSFYEIE